MYDVYVKFNVYFNRLLTIPESSFLRKGIKDHLKRILEKLFSPRFRGFSQRY